MNYWQLMTGAFSLKQGYGSSGSSNFTGYNIIRHRVLQLTVFAFFFQRCQDARSAVGDDQLFVHVSSTAPVHLPLSGIAPWLHALHSEKAMLERTPIFRQPQLQFGPVPRVWERTPRYTNPWISLGHATRGSPL